MADNLVFNEPIPWKIDENGMLLLGVENQTTVFNMTSSDRRGSSDVKKPFYGVYGEMPWRVYSDDIKGVKCVGDIKCTGGAFYGLFSHLHNAEVIDMSRMDMSEVNNMNSMFYGCENVKTIILPEKLEGESKACMSMFENCESLEHIENMDELRKVKARDVEGMFSYCGSLKEIDLSGMDVSEADNMYALFAGCKSAERIKVKGWDTSKVTTMVGMFGQCHSLTDIDISHFKTDNLWNTVAMFDECSNLEIVYLPRGENPKLNTVDEMFEGCKSLTSDISYFDISSATSMTGMLDYCNSEFVSENLPALRASYDSGRMLMVEGLSSDFFTKSLNPLAVGLKTPYGVVAVPRMAVYSEEDGTKSVSLIKDKFYPARDMNGNKQHYCGREISEYIEEVRAASVDYTASLDLEDDSYDVSEDLDGPDL